MDFSLMTEPQLGGTYDQLLDLARWARGQGMVSFARSDHYYSSREPRPDATDAFATLAGLAREVPDIRLCVMVSPITFRHPAVLAKTAATIDRMSGGRLDLGVGTGWMELEHEAFGIPFPEWSERFARLTEALGYLRAAFEGRGFEGEHYSLEADARPRPEGTRLIVGGSGKQKTPTLAGIYADEYNHFPSEPDVLRPKIELVRRTAEERGRDPEAITMSVMGQIFTGRDASDVRERLASAAARRDLSPDDLEERLREHGIPVGPPDRIGEALAGLSDAGVSHWYLQWIDLDDRDGLEATWQGVRSALS